MDFILAKNISFAIPYSLSNSRVQKVLTPYYESIRNGSNGKRGHNGNPPSDKYWLRCSISLRDGTVFEEVKVLIDEAVKDSKWMIIMLHGINPETASLTTYQTTPKLLEEILVYINSFGKDELLPINQRDAIRYICK